MDAATSARRECDQVPFVFAIVHTHRGGFVGHQVDIAARFVGRDGCDGDGC